MNRARTLAAALALTAVAAAGCGSESTSSDSSGTDPAGSAESSTSEPAPESTTEPASPSPTPAADPPRSARTDFCAGIARQAIRTGIEGESVYDERWEPGQSYEVIGGAHARGAEWGCAWTAADGTSVTAWLFAEPVTPEAAADLVPKAKGNCESKRLRAPGSQVAVTVQCISDDDTVTRTQALYGDAWLSCALQTPGILTRLERAAAWCDAVRAAALT